MTPKTNLNLNPIASTMAEFSTPGYQVVSRRTSLFHIALFLIIPVYVRIYVSTSYGPLHILPVHLAIWLAFTFFMSHITRLGLEPEQRPSRTYTQNILYKITAYTYTHKTILCTYTYDTLSRIILCSLLAWVRYVPYVNWVVFRLGGWRWEGLFWIVALRVVLCLLPRPYGKEILVRMKCRT
jgi:hypothetical protein